jgi:ribosomal protein S18 acetylase RimI-like enzyme
VPACLPVLPAGNRQVVTTLATAKDAESLAFFAREAMTRHFGHLYSAEDLVKRHEEAYSTNYFLGYINNPKLKLYIAFRKDERGLPTDSVVGYIIVGPLVLDISKCDLSSISRDQIDLASIVSVSGEIGRLFIAPEYFGTGLGGELWNLGMKWLTDAQSCKYIFLGTMSENFRAQKFYAKNGFFKVGEYNFQFASCRTTEFIMLRIQP